MMNGTIKTIYNPDSPFVYDGRKDRTEATETTTTNTTTTSTSSTSGLSTAEITIENEIDSVFINDDGKIVVLDHDTLSFKKIEIFRLTESDSVLVYSTTGFASGKQINFLDKDGLEGWDGNSNEEKKVQIGNYKLLMTGAIDESYENGFYDFEEFTVDVEGFTRNSGLLTINADKEEFFIREDSVPVKYSAASELSGFKIKLEILQSNASLTPGGKIFEQAMDFGNEVSFKMGTIDGWTGRNQLNKFVDEGYYLIRVIASPDDKFEKGYQDYETVQAKKRPFNAITVVSDSITQASTEAVAFGTSFVGNITSPACNICTRAAVYISSGRGDTVLFPLQGSRIGETTLLYLKGLVTNPGQANNIADNLQAGSISRWMFIPDMPGEDYPDFEELQTEANDGHIIIGTYRNNSGSGHVVMIVPGEAEKYSDVLIFKGYDSLIKFPKVLECGTDHRESKTSAFDNISIEKLKKMKWYRLVN